jgi:hypothetical protein
MEWDIEVTKWRIIAMTDSARPAWFLQGDRGAPVGRPRQEPARPARKPAADNKKRPPE